MADGRTDTKGSSSNEGEEYIGTRRCVNYLMQCFIRSSAQMAKATYAATVAVATSDHGPFSPRVLTQRAM